MKTIQELIDKLSEISQFAHLSLATVAENQSGIDRIIQICKESGGYNIFQDGIAGYGMPGDIVVTYTNDIWGFYVVDFDSFAAILQTYQN